MFLQMWPRDYEIQTGDWCKSREEELRSVTHIADDEHFIIRVDGRAFHTFTRGMERPFSDPFRNAMKSAASTVLKELKPQFVYFQSDEITFGWVGRSTPGYTHPFKGKVAKLLSVVASLTSVAFYKGCEQNGIDVEHKLPHFDARLVEVLPFNGTVESMLKPVLWRENDAMRNSVQMVAQSMMSQAELHGVNVYKAAKMTVERGYDWEATPPGYLRGTYLTMGSEHRTLTAEELQRIPEEKRPGPDETYKRGVVKEHYFTDWDLVARMKALLPMVQQ